MKRKALRLIAKCAEDAGSRDRRFAREMAKVSGRIRALQTHVGTPHPSKGDSVNASVREAAKEAMSAIFGSEREIHREDTRGDGRATAVVGEGGVAGLGGRITGFGDGSSASGDGGATLGGRLMSREGGFGARSSPSSRSIDDEDSPRRGATTATARPGTLDAPLEASLASTPKLNIEGGGVKWKPLRPPSPERKREGGAGASRSTAVDLLGDLDAVTSNARPAVVPAANASSNRRAASSSSASREDFNLDGSEEQRAIEKLCALSGVRIAPAESDIDAFLSAGSRLNSKGVVVAIAEKLVTYAGDSWRVAYRAVCVLERAAQSDATGRWLVDVFVNSSAMDLLESITVDASVHVQLKHKATACVAALRSSSAGVAGGASASTTTAPPKPTAPASSIDLLSQLGDLSVSAPPPVAASSSPNVLDDLFAAPVATSAPTGYRAPTAPMRGPGLAALNDIAPTSEEQKLKNTKAFDFVSDLMK